VKSTGWASPFLVGACGTKAASLVNLEWVQSKFQNIDLRVVPQRFESWEHFVLETPEYSIGLEVMDDTPGHRGRHVHFDHHAGVVREATMSAAMQAYMAVRQGRLMERWLPKQRPVPVYVWNADQDVCLAAFVLEHHELLERSEGAPLLRWIVQYNNKIDVCGGLYPVNIDELVQNHFTWVFEPYRQQRMVGRTRGDEALIRETIRQVCARLWDLLEGKAGIAPVTAEPEILYTSPYHFVIADEKGDPNSRLVLGAQGHTNLISLICTRPDGRYTYSIIRGSPFDEDVFPVIALIDALQKAENNPGARIWGGSNLAAGSDSEFGSGLHWTEVRDIAEPIVRKACLSSITGQIWTESDRVRPGVLLVMGPECRDQLQIGLVACGVEPFLVTCCDEARKVLDLESQIAVIFTSLRLPDGSFTQLVQMAQRHQPPPPIVTCIGEIDGGWIDLLEAGAFHVLAQPYEPDQIRGVLEAAMCGSYGREVSASQ
jgi:hypothetical protein